MDGWMDIMSITNDVDGRYKRIYPMDGWQIQLGITSAWMVDLSG